MFRPRVIPVLLLRGHDLIKSVGFKNYRYIGDPINAVKIFNDLKADELVFLDILASKEKRSVPVQLIKDIGEEANMPFSAGGGISSLDQIRRIIGAGAEKVIINTYAAQNPDFILQASETFGSSTIVVCMDVKRNFLGKEKTWTLNGCKPTKYSPVEFARLMAEKGAGELIVQSIEKDGSMQGYDIDLIKKISESVSIPVIALGGAGSLTHLKEGYEKGFASALAAGSMFVFHGERKAVLVNYPRKSELTQLFK
jgi:imidazole glycerol-phosphate synthase subunit HisF